MTDYWYLTKIDCLTAERDTLKEEIRLREESQIPVIPRGAKELLDRLTADLATLKSDNERLTAELEMSKADWKVVARIVNALRQALADSNKGAERRAALELIFDESACERLARARRDYHSTHSEYLPQLAALLNATRADLAILERDALKAENERLKELMGPEYHIFDRSEDDWALQHPLSCRPNLLACELHQVLVSQPDEHPWEPGSYRVDVDDDGFLAFQALADSAPAKPDGEK